MEKVLLLGSDYGTDEIIRKLHERNYYIICADYYEDTPAKEKADESWLVSTNDFDELEKRCRKEKVAGVITGASEFNVGNSRILCRRLGLPVYCGNDTAWAATKNKLNFRKACMETGAPMAKAYSLDAYLADPEYYEIQFPIIVKPVDMSANRGMSYCNNKDELDRAIEYAHTVSRNEQLILEKKLEGPEFAVNYVIADGEPRLFFFSAEHHQPGQLANLYSVINTTNYHLDQYLEEMNDKVVAVFKKIGVTEGVAWVECMLDKDSHFYLLETGYRFGAEIVNIPYEDVSGFDSINWMIDCQLGIKHTVQDLPQIQKYEGIACAYMLFAKRSGTISKIEGLDEVRKIPGVKPDMTKMPGRSAVKRMTIGVVRIYGTDCDDLCRKIEQVNQSLRILDENGDDLILKFDDFASLKEEYQKGLAGNV